MCIYVCKGCLCPYYMYIHVYMCLRSCVHVYMHSNVYHKTLTYVYQELTPSPLYVYVLLCILNFFSTAPYPHYDCMLSSLSPYRMTVCGSFERRLPRARLSCCLLSAPRPIPQSLRRSSLARSGASSGGNCGNPPRSPRPLARSQSWTPERSGWTSTRRSQRVILWPTSTRPVSPGRICRASRRLLRPQSPVLRLGIRLSIEPGGGRR